MKNLWIIYLYYNKNMTFNILQLETDIKTKLELLSNVNFVYDHYTLKTEWYPYASFELSSFDWSFADSCSNFRIQSFNVIIIQNISDDMDRQWAKTILYNILNEIVATFDWDMTLWNSNVIRWEVLKWEMWTFLSQEWDVLALNVEINLTVNNSII